MKILNIYIILLILCVLPLTAQLKDSIYDEAACGLNFIHKSKRIGSRGLQEFPQDHLPASFTISELPTQCYNIEKAYVYWIISAIRTNAKIITCTIKKGKDSLKVRADTVGTDGPKMYGERGTVGYRADVTNFFKNDGTDNGNLTVNVNTDEYDTDGISLLIIYKNYKAPYKGFLRLQHFFLTTNLNTTKTLSGYNVPPNVLSNSGKGFLFASDFHSSKPKVFGLAL